MFSLEEADTLATRIAIVADGTLQAVGGQQQLKRQHGDGDKLTVNMQSLSDTRDGNAQRISLAFVQNQAMMSEGTGDALNKLVFFVCTDIYPGAVLFAIDGKKVQFQLPRVNTGASATESLHSLLSVFDNMDRHQRRLLSVFHIEEWALAHTSLEEVFMKIVHNIENKKLNDRKFLDFHKNSSSFSYSGFSAPASP